MPTNHDLFLIGDQEEVSRTRIVAGVLEDPPELLAALDAPGRRKVLNLAAPAGFNPPRGPGFSILPNRPDPNLSEMSCYLINPHNLFHVNEWSATEWNDSSPERPPEPPPVSASPAFDALIAGPQGRVYFLRRDADPVGVAVVRELDERELATEAELWTQLRNGLVAGTVNYEGHPNAPTTVAAFNVTSVLPPTKG